MFDIIINPFITILLFLYQILGGNVVLAIIVFTILVRLATYPLTMKQQRSTKAMQELQPAEKLRKIQERQERLAQAQMGCAGRATRWRLSPLFIQLPIMIGLYRAIVATRRHCWNCSTCPTGCGSRPVDIVPLQNRFLWLNFAVRTVRVLPILVVGDVAAAKLIAEHAVSSAGEAGSGCRMTPDDDDRARCSVFALTYASGLSVYFIASGT